ncbi:MAG: M1 family metallopeptidase [Bacteroidales bacterium]|jgi:aminopeptidase N|nr:M1 family metallopeptidase [Bacteroidales bacterium]
MKIYLYFFYFFFYTCGHAQPYAPVPDWYQDYDIKFYKIDIEADHMTTAIKGKADVVAAIEKTGLDRLILELGDHLHVDSVWLDGNPVSFRHADGLLYAYSSFVLTENQDYTISVSYSVADKKNEGFFSAITNRKDDSWNIPVTWTLSQPYNAKNWFPCKQHLPDKADSAYLFITVPGHLKAGAPGILSSVTPMPDNKLRYEWKTRYPVAYYLLSFAVSEYREYNIYTSNEQTGDPVLIQNYIYDRDGYLENNQSWIDTTRSLIGLYSKLFLPYPFANEKYGHCAAPMGGGMEHQTMTTISSFDFLLVAHELAHQWFGNLVTCASFQDVWINEGFATYSEYLALEYLGSARKATRWMLDTHEMATWSKQGSIFIPKESANDIWRIFSMSLSYKKGAALVHYIRYIINDDETFFGLLREFLKKYAFSVATGMDFKNFAQEYTGIDLTHCFDQWYFGEGHPVFGISWRKNGPNVELLLEHTGSSKSNPLFITDLDICFNRSGANDTLIRVPILTNKEFFVFDIPGNVTEIKIDPYYYVLKEIQSLVKVKDFPTADDMIQCDTYIKRRQNLMVNFSKETERNCRLKLTDPQGTKVYLDVSSGKKRTITLPMEDLPDGNYLLYVNNGKDQYIRNILKANK